MRTTSLNRKYGPDGATLQSLWLTYAVHVRWGNSAKADAAYQRYKALKDKLTK